MPEIGTSGLMSEDGKRSVATWPKPPRLSSTLLRQAKLVRSSRWKNGPSKGQRPLGSECCVAVGDTGDLHGVWD